MKLTHRDFRPQRRSKYVALPLKRRPTLRILILAALGIAVYLQYDSVVHSKVFQNLRQPRRWVDAMLNPGQLPATPLQADGLVWSQDSAQVEGECPDEIVDACLNRWRSRLGRTSIGALRADLSKASLQLGADAAKGIKVRFMRSVDTGAPLEGLVAPLELMRLELRGEKVNLILERLPGVAGSPLCDQQRCLDALNPQTPFARFRLPPHASPDGFDKGSILEAGLIPLAGEKALPILRGRIVSSPVEMAPDQWVKVYHGGNTFSYYRGFASLGTGLKQGSMIEPGETLGIMALNEDSTARLDLRIEKDGIRVDPLEFLGIGSERVANAPEPDTLHAH